MNIGEFFVQLGVKAETSTLKDFVGWVGKIPIETAAAITSIAAIEYRLASLASQMVENAVNFGIFHSATGLSTQELQRWQMVAERVGVSAESVASTMKNLQRSIVGTRFNGTSFRPFAMLGVNPLGKDPIQVLNELHRRIKVLPRDYFAYWSSQIGLSDEMIRVLDLDDRKFSEFMNHAHGMTPKVISQFQALKETMTGLGQSFRDFGIDFLSGTITYIEKFYHALKDIPDVMFIVKTSFEALKDIGMVLKLVLDGIVSALEALKGKSIVGALSNVKMSDFGVPPAEAGKDVWGTIMNSLMDQMRANANVGPAFAAGALGGKLADTTLNFYITGMVDTAETFIDLAVDAMKRELGINARVQINNNAVKRGQ